MEGSPFPAAIRDLGLKTTQFSSVFNKVAQMPGPTGLAGPAEGQGVASPVTGPLAHLGIDVGRHMTVWPAVTAVPETTPKKSTKGHHKSPAQSDRLGPILRDKEGRRVDKPLNVSNTVFERMKKEGPLCYSLFLRGSCVLRRCGRSHAHQSLTDEEFDALWRLARRGRCQKSQKADGDAGNDCSDILCIYGHRNGEK